MKTRIKIRADYYQGIFKVGQKGYIDGYVRDGNDIPLAVVIIDKVIDLVPIHNIEVIIKE